MVLVVCFFIIFGSVVIKLVSIMLMLLMVVGVEGSGGISFSFV